MGVVSRAIYYSALNETFRVTFQAFLLYAPAGAQQSHKLLLTLLIQTAIIGPHVIVYTNKFLVLDENVFWERFGTDSWSIFIILLTLGVRKSG